MSDIDKAFGAMAGVRIPGGCDSCNAYQTTGEHDGIYVITVHHDSWCSVHGEAAS